MSYEGFIIVGVCVTIVALGVLFCCGFCTCYLYCKKRWLWRAPVETPVETQRRRCDLVRERLECRKILASLKSPKSPKSPQKKEKTPKSEKSKKKKKKRVKSKEKSKSDKPKKSSKSLKSKAETEDMFAAELGPPIEPDLEMGEGGNGVPICLESLNHLSQMGFSINASRKALSNVGGSDTEAAMDWIFDHGNDTVTPELTLTLTPHVQREESDSKISANARDNTAGSVRSFLTSSMFFLKNVGLAGANPKDEEECCSICLEGYKVGDTVARLKRTSEQEAREKRCETIHEEEHHDECNHWFHEDCIMEWLENKDECPLCRKNMVQS